jgi:hypothetical protein
MMAKVIKISLQVLLLQPAYLKSTNLNSIKLKLFSINNGPIKGNLKMMLPVL